MITAGLALLGFVCGFFIAAVAGFEATNEAECDGPCFDQWDEAFLIAIGVGLLSAAAAGFVTWFKLEPSIEERDTHRAEE